MEENVIDTKTKQLKYFALTLLVLSNMLWTYAIKILSKAGIDKAVEAKEDLGRW